MKYLILLFLFLNLSCAFSAYSKQSHSLCFERLSDENKLLSNNTQTKFLKPEVALFPRSQRASKLVHEASKNKSLPAEVGCVALKFEITEHGKAENIKVIKAMPDTIFVKASITALKRSEFVKKVDTGIYIYSFQLPEE